MLLSVHFSKLKTPNKRSMSPFVDHLVGIVRVPVDNLRFVSPHSHTGSLEHPENSKTTARLVKVFRETGWEPSDSKHQIFGIINPSTFNALLRYSSLSRDGFRQTILSGQYPLVNGDFEVLCVEGRRRVAAAQALLGREAWWTIKLHCISQGIMSTERLRILIY